MTIYNDGRDLIELLRRTLEHDRYPIDPLFVVRTIPNSHGVLIVELSRDGVSKRYYVTAIPVGGGPE